MSTDDEITVYTNYAESRQLTSDLWKVGPSKQAGRGLISQKDLPSGTFLFREPPLIIGPRDDPRCASVCVGCHQSSSNLRTCSRGCGLPVCNFACETSALHKECSLLARLPNFDCRHKLPMVAPVRALDLSSNDRSLLCWLEGHQRPQHALVITPLSSILKPDDLSLVQKCCQVLDTTAYETPCKNGSVRGLYPTAALMNHNCTPNTRHCFDETGHMIVETSRFVPAGEELYVSYTCLTWGTCTRQAHLKASKAFHCQCERCLDPIEFGARLMALYCPKRGCSGVLLPIYPSKCWHCTECSTELSNQKISIIHRMMSGVLAKSANGNPREGCRVLLNNSMVPGSNQIAVEFKLSLIRLYGNETGFSWPELRDDDVQLKQLFCIQLILLLTLLKLGQCRQRGFILLELVATVRELDRRKSKSINLHDFKELFDYGTIQEMYQEAESILKYDANSKDRLEKAKQYLQP